MATKNTPVMPKKRPNKAGSSKQSKAQRAKMFVEVYLSNGNNATDAAIHAGYSEKGAAVQGCRMLRQPNVLSRIAERRAEIVKELGLHTDNVMRQLSYIVKSDIRKLFNPDGSLKPIDSWPDEVAGSVGAVKIAELFDGTGKDRKQIGHTKEIKLWDKNSGIDKAMKHLGLFQADHDQEKKSLHEFFNSCMGHGLKVKKIE